MDKCFPHCDKIVRRACDLVLAPESRDSEHASCKAALQDAEAELHGVECRVKPFAIHNKLFDNNSKLSPIVTEHYKSNSNFTEWVDKVVAAKSIVASIATIHSTSGVPEKSQCMEAVSKLQEHKDFLKVNSSAETKSRLDSVLEAHDMAAAARSMLKTESADFERNCSSALSLCCDMYRALCEDKAISQEDQKTLRSKCTLVSDRLHQYLKLAPYSPTKESLIPALNWAQDHLFTMLQYTPTMRDIFAGDTDIDALQTAFADDDDDSFAKLFRSIQSTKFDAVKLNLVRLMGSVDESIFDTFIRGTLDLAMAMSSHSSRISAKYGGKFSDAISAMNNYPPPDETNDSAFVKMWKFKQCEETKTGLTALLAACADAEDDYKVVGLDKQKEEAYVKASALAEQVEAQCTRWAVLCFLEKDDISADNAKGKKLRDHLRKIWNDNKDVEYVRKVLNAKRITQCLGEADEEADANNEDVREDQSDTSKAAASKEQNKQSGQKGGRTAATGTAKAAGKGRSHRSAAKAQAETQVEAAPSASAARKRFSAKRAPQEVGRTASSAAAEVAGA